jgi:hypothetical protein
MQRETLAVSDSGFVADAAFSLIGFFGEPRSHDDHHSTTILRQRSVE